MAEAVFCVSTVLCAVSKVNEIILHIQFLLRRHDCVIVPGLGAFIAVRREAAFDEESMTLTPPTREITFNPLIVNNDGVVASSISRRESVSYEEACRRMQEYVAALREAIFKEGSVEIGSVGTLASTAEEKIIFRPRHTAARFSRMLGYAPVALKGEVRTGASADSPVVEDTDRSKHYHISVNKAFVRMAMMVAVFVLAAISVVLPISREERNDYASVVPAGVVSAIKESALGLEDTVSAPADDDTAVMSAETAEVEIQPAHYLIVATFRNRAEAARYVRLNAGGSWRLDTVGTRNVCRVYAAQSSSREELLSLMRDASFRQSYSEAWIWSRE